MRSAYERFIEKVDFSGECWQWTAYISPTGYGQFTVGAKTVNAHRWAWETVYGEVPDGLEIDHTCHNDSGCVSGIACSHRACMNVSHMELVTGRENTRRGNSANGSKTRCPQGHPYSEENTHVYGGYRRCLACDRIKHRRTDG